MTDLAPETLAVALLAHLSAPAEEKDATFPAWERVQDLIDGGRPDAAWQVIRLAASRATPMELNRLGAGLLESLLDAHGPAVIDRVEAEARRSPALGAALRAVYVDSFEPVVARRIEGIRARRPARPHVAVACGLLAGVVVPVLGYAYLLGAHPADGRDLPWWLRIVLPGVALGPDTPGVALFAGLALLHALLWFAAGFGAARAVEAVSRRA